MKRYIVMLIIVLFFSYNICADAREGSIEVYSSVGEDVTFSYVKVAELVDGRYVKTETFKDCEVDLNELNNAYSVRNAIVELQSVRPKEKEEIKTEQGKAEIRNLKEGIYLLEHVSKGDYQVASMLVKIPFLDEETGQVSYDVVLQPKWESGVEDVETGDIPGGGIYILICLTALGLILFVACHKRFKCAKIR